MVHTLEFGRLSPSLSRAFQDTPFCVLCVMCLGRESEGVRGWRDEKVEKVRPWRDERVEG